MAQQLQACTHLPEDRSSELSTQVKWFTAACNYSFGTSDTSSGLHRQLYTHVHIHTQRHTYKHINKNKINIFKKSTMGNLRAFDFTVSGQVSICFDCIIIHFLSPYACFGYLSLKVEKGVQWQDWPQMQETPRLEGGTSECLDEEGIDLCPSPERDGSRCFCGVSGEIPTQ